MGTKYRDLDYRPCTREELGIDDPTSDEAIFYPLHKNSVGYFPYWKKLLCIDDEVEIHGNYNSADVSHLQLTFEKCDPEKRKCKSEEEIIDAMRKLFIITLHNSIRFD